MTLTRQSLKDISKDMEIAMQSVIEKHGLHSIMATGATMFENSFKISFEVKANKPENDTEMQRAFEILGLPVDSYGKTFNYFGDKCEVIGVDLKKVKYPVIVRNHDKKKTLAFIADTVKRALNK